MPNAAAFVARAPLVCDVDADGVADVVAGSKAPVAATTKRHRISSVDFI
jgi:hypothetical protein